MKVTFLLLASVCVLAVGVSGKKSKCEKQAQKAEQNGEWVPQCNKAGKFQRKQCNQQYCWCVNRKTGERKFGNLTIPLNHDYNCKGKPKNCLRELLEILMEDPFTPQDKLPQCDERGRYDPKQCTFVRGRKCREQEDIKKRHTTSPFPNCTVPELHGFPAVTAPQLDSADVWTMVHVDPVLQDAEISSFELFVGGTARKFRVGIYRPTAYTCQFELVQQKEWASLGLNYQLVEMDVGERLQIEWGDHIGFSWLDLGVVQYSNTGPTFNYCEDALVFDVNDIASLFAGRHGNREYSIRFRLQGRGSYLGHEPIGRPQIDGAGPQTMVNTAPFPSEGQIQAVEVYAGGTGTSLNVGLYRPTSNCEYELLKQITLSPILTGVFNRFVLAGADLIDVDQGDSFGFSWSGNSVVNYSVSPSQHFCHVGSVYSPTTTILMSSASGKRDYSIQVEFIECDSVTFAKRRKCLECYCVDRNSGEVLEGTRTTDIDDLQCY